MSQLKGKDLMVQMQKQKPHQLKQQQGQQLEEQFQQVQKLGQRGQVIIEMVLLLVLVVGLWGMFSNYAKQKKWFENLVTGPWQSTAGMIEAGVWEPPQKAIAKHPNNFNRVVSLKEQ